MMKVLVTGAGGFLGGAVTRKLLALGHEVYNFSRSSYTHLHRLGVKQFQGDLSHLKQLRVAFEQMPPLDAIIHSASITGMWGNWADFKRINVIGTKNLLNMSQEFNVKNFVYTSSPSVVFGKKDIEGADESIDYPKEHLCFYAKSKAMAEQLVMQENQVKGLKTVSLRPHLIWGPGDPHLLPRLIQRAKEGKLKIIGKGKNKVDVIYIDNAADAHICALNKLIEGQPVDGKSYFLGQNEPVLLWNFINKLLAIHNISPVTRKVPLKTAYNLGYLMEKWFEWKDEYDKWPMMTRFVALQLGKSHYFNHSLAKRELGYDSKISIEQGLKLLEESISRSPRTPIEI